MDLVDIDKVLDSLELNEEEHQHEIKPIVKHCKITSPSYSAVNTPQSNVSSSVTVKEIDYPSPTQHNSTTITTDRVNRFVGVSQVFSSLDDYRKNIESLDLYTNNRNNENAISNTNSSKNNEDTLFIRNDRNSRNDKSVDDVDDDDIVDETLIVSKPHSSDDVDNVDNDDVDEDDNEEDDPYVNDEINKFVSTDEYGFSSNSITTSSSSTFSSGPSPALISTESEVSPNDTNLDDENEQVTSSIMRTQLEDTDDGELNVNSKHTTEKEKSTSEDINSFQPIESLSDSSNVKSQKKQNRSEFDDLAVGLSSISLTTQEGSNLSLSDIVPASSKYILKADNISSSLSLSQTTRNNNNDDEKDILKKQYERVTIGNSEKDVILRETSAGVEKVEKVAPTAGGLVQQNVMVTFSSTMDDISDTELDSILQEIDTEIQSFQFLSPEKEHVDADVSSLPLTEDILNPSPDMLKNQPDSACYGTAAAGCSSKHFDDGLMNIDSFSQASTLEFTEDRPKDVYVENEIADKIGDDTCENKVKKDLQKKQRPTTLDLPARKINLYATAGQTPPGSRIYGQVTPSSDDETSDDVDCSDQQPEGNNYSDGVDFNNSAGHTPPERTDRELVESSDSSTDVMPDENNVGNNDVSCSINNKAPKIYNAPNESVIVTETSQTEASLAEKSSPTIGVPSTLLPISELSVNQNPASSLETTNVTTVTVNSNNRSVNIDENSHTNNNDSKNVKINSCNIGKIPPVWVPDQEANVCMQCQHKFTLLKRRHHCRACGQVLCSVCCSQKFKLEFLSNLESRVCVQCFFILTKQQKQQQVDDQHSSAICNANTLNHVDHTDKPTTTTVVSPNPNNPMEYCSKIPPYRQVNPQTMTSYPSVIVPVGVLKKDGSNAGKSRKRKSVIFSDGIRPGSDLANLDSKWSDAKHARKSTAVSGSSGAMDSQTEGTLNVGESSQNILRTNSVVLINDEIGCYIPQTDEYALPPIVVTNKLEKSFQEVTNDADLIKRLQTESLKFVIQNNFFVYVKISHLKCCINKTVINFTTCGLNNVGNDEIIILLELDASNKVPKDIFIHLNEIYWEASRGHPITELGFSMPKHLNFLGSREHGGFLFIRSTFQCLLDVHVPEPPFLIGVLIHRWEVPWAKIFPLRLMLRLGAQYRYYPSPHISVREREPVYAEIAQTIINLLADFRNYTYTIPTIKGMYIHMEDRRTNILIPRNRLDEVIKATNNSSDHILAMGANFSKKADGHLVCIQNTKYQNDDSHSYSTQAINIQGQPRKVTGASFFVFNEALKTTSGLSGKCSIIEDGLMVQILPSKMAEIRQSLINMKDINIVCGPIQAEESQTEVVHLQWVDDDVEINIGVRSPIDSKKMDGIPSIRVHSGTSLSNNKHILKWTEVFLIEMSTDNASLDISKLSEQIARNASLALLPLLDLLVANGSVKLGLRVTLNNDNVSYEAGSQNEKLPPLYMNALDNELIQLLHKQANEIGRNVILELIFHILNVNINV